MLTLGYGEFDAQTFWGMFLEVLPKLVGWYVVPACSVYLVAAITAEACRYRLLGILIYLFVFLLLSWNLCVMGAYGPAHIALETGFWIWPALFIVLVIKTILLYMGIGRNRAIEAARLARQCGQCCSCGYSLRGVYSARCPECGTENGAERMTAASQNCE